MGYCILFLKGNQDVIRNISRLDKLYIVSQFQIRTALDDPEDSDYSSQLSQSRRTKDSLKKGKSGIVKQSSEEK